MLHIANLIFLFVIAFGIVALYIAIQIYKEYRFEYLRSHIYMLTGFNVVIFSNIIESYLKIVVPIEKHPVILHPYFNVILFILPLILIITTYHAFIFIWGLIDKKIPRTVKILSYVVALLFIAVQIYYFITSASVWDTPLNYFSAMTIQFLFYFVWWYLLGMVFPPARKIKNAGRKKAVELYAGIMLIMGFIYFFLTIAGVYELISMNMQMLLLGFVLLGFFLFPVTFIKWFFKQFRGDYDSSPKFTIDELAEKYSVSRREIEIIKLVLKGKSNKEIAEELFIAPVTVRDHLSKIYKKTNVKTRLQLANIFRQ
ncbi:MAG: hypothetical protein A2V66_10230 [Ignavibacteria bacterium RBG_13_36_8]|nr:MAG: hypothetical protein A2V66_10230 [Ignavibacteria bacterium RBG_13_36_8]